MFILRIQVYQIIMVILCTIGKVMNILASIQQNILSFKENVLKFRVKVQKNPI